MDIFCQATWKRCYRQCRRECAALREQREQPHLLMATLTYPCGSMGEEAVSQEAARAEASWRAINVELMARYGTTRVRC